MRWQGGDFGGSEPGGFGGGNPLEELIQKVQQKMLRFGSGKILLIAAVILIGLWLASGIYMVGPGRGGGDPTIRQGGGSHAARVAIPSSLASSDA